MIKRALSIGVLWAVITLAIVYLLGFMLEGISESGTFFIIIAFIMLLVQVGSIAYLTVLIESNRPKIENEIKIYKQQEPRHLSRFLYI